MELALREIDLAGRFDVDSQSRKDLVALVEARVSRWSRPLRGWIGVAWLFRLAGVDCFILAVVVAISAIYGASPDPPVPPPPVPPEGGGLPLFEIFSLGAAIPGATASAVVARNLVVRPPRTRS